MVEERPVKGTTTARKTAEILATSLNVTATVYGADADGEFVYGVYEVADGAANAASPVIKKLFAESVTASLAFKDQLLADLPEDIIKGFAAMSAALGYLVTQHKQIKRAATPQISYSTLFRIFAAGAILARFRCPPRCDHCTLDAKACRYAGLDVAERTLRSWQC